MRPSNSMPLCHPISLPAVSSSDSLVPSILVLKALRFHIPNDHPTIVIGLDFHPFRRDIYHRYVHGINMIAVSLA